MLIEPYSARFSENIPILFPTFYGLPFIRGTRNYISQKHLLEGFQKSYLNDRLLFKTDQDWLKRGENCIIRE